MSYIDANYVRANRILPTSLSGGGSSFSKTTGGSGYGVNGGGIIIDASHSSMLGNVNWPEKPTI